MRHMAAWTWCSRTMRGQRAHTGREERHAVPDLDEPVGTSPAPHQPAQGTAGEHAVATRLADDLVPGSGRDRLLARRGRGPHGDVDAGPGPGRGHPMGVELRSSRLGVLEVPPGEDLHTVQADLQGPGGHGVETDDGEPVD